MAEPQNPPVGDHHKKLEELKKAKELADAEKAALDAQRQLLEARKALEQAQKPPDPAEHALKAQVDAAKAAKELADAKKAQRDAELAAFKAAVGEVPSPPQTGSVELKTDAGKMEATLLATQALRQAASQIDQQCKKAATGQQNVVLFASGEMPNFQAYMNFKAQVNIIKKAFADAQENSDKVNKAAEPPPVIELAVPPLGAAGVVLSAINNLLGFFRTDYSIGGFEVSIEDSVLVSEIAGRLSNGNTKWTVKIPALFDPAALNNAGSEVIGALTALSLKKDDAVKKQSEHERAAGVFQKMATEENDEGKKNDLEKKAQLQTLAAQVQKRAVSLFDGWFGKLSAIDDKTGAVPLVTVIREGAVATALEAGRLLLVAKLHKSGGAYYTKKSMWSVFFPGIPLYHMGGTVASFALLEGKTGNVLAAGAVPIHGGFVKAKDVQKRLGDP